MSLALFLVLRTSSFFTPGFSCSVSATTFISAASDKRPVSSSTKMHCSSGEEAYGPEHADIAHGLNNLAIVYRIMGEHSEAERLHLRALAIRKKVHGEERSAASFISNCISASSATSVLIFVSVLAPHSGQSSVRQGKLSVSDWVQVPIE